MPEPFGSPDHQSSAAEPPQGDLAGRVTELEEEIRSLRKELWQSRDATIGATATAGSYKARNVELEMLIHQLRTELAKMDAKLQVAQGSLSGRMNAVLGLPRRVVRKMLRP